MVRTEIDINQAYGINQTDSSSDTPPWRRRLGGLVSESNPPSPLFKKGGMIRIPLCYFDQFSSNLNPTFSVTW